MHFQCTLQTLVVSVMANARWLFSVNCYLNCYCTAAPQWSLVSLVHVADVRMANSDVRYGPLSMTVNCPYIPALFSDQSRSICKVSSAILQFLATALIFQTALIF